MNARQKLLPVVLGALLGVACAGLFGHVNPVPTDHLRFPHQKHLDMGQACTDCHQKISTAKDLSQLDIPGHDVCMQCHDKKADCKKCHSDPTAAAPLPKPHPTLAFNHENHIKRMNGECKDCHQELPEIGKPARMPTMAACFQSCHDGKHKTSPHHAWYAAGECGSCHLNLWENPLKPQSLFAHQGDWLHEHPLAARSEGAACSQCHPQTFCSDCHAAKTVAAGPNKLQFDRVDRQLIHRANWLAEHPIEANANPAECERCHTLDQCASCHNRHQVGASATNPRSPHPAGWAFPGSAQFHGDAARMNITSCAACHEHGGHSDCVTCHKVGGIGGNPHPVDWDTRHKTVDRANPMCMECHI